MTIEKLTLKKLSDYLKPRARDFHKGLAGHVLIVGGDYGYSGAVRLAAEAALRVGAGLVSVATREENAIVQNVMRPEIMCHGVTSPLDLEILLEKASVIVAGPGLGRSAWARELLCEILQSNKEFILDADALNILAEEEKPISKSNWVLTPHPGEAARLLKKNVEAIQKDRLLAVKNLQQIYGGVCVLKGAGSLISVNNETAICEKGNPGMASAGMGDVLSGVIGGLAAQRIPLTDAAKIGVLIHAEAGDLAAKEKGERGLIASDLMPYLHQLVNP